MKNACMLMVALVVVVVSQEARAGDTAERQAIQAVSRGRVLNQSVVPALMRKRGPGNAERLADVLETLPSVVRLDGTAERRDNGGSISLASSSHWFVTVGSEGDHFDYRDEDLANAPVWDQAPGMPLDELIAQGRAVLEGPLAPLVALEPSEKLVAIHSSQEVRGVRDNRGALLAETVAVNVIEFARSVNDVPVLGNGSRVRLGFSPRGELVSLDADWPRYKVLPAQRLAVATPQTVAARETAIREHLGVPTTMSTSHFECGYLDNGRSTLLQPGCRVVVRDGDHGEARAFRVPAAEVPANDPTWSEIGVLLRGGVQ